MYRYYLTQRPPSIGTHPAGAVNTVCYDFRIITEHGFPAWGYVEYTEPLTDKQVEDFELKKVFE